MITGATLAGHLGLTKLQTNLLLVMIAGQGGKTNKFVSSSKMAWLLNSKWSNYRHKQMMQMQQQGIVCCVKFTWDGARQWHYSLWDKAEAIYEIVSGVAE